MGYGETSRKRIANGRCVGCGTERVDGRVKCDKCVRIERINFRQRKLAEMATCPAMKKRLVALWKYLGVGASPDQVKAVYDLERSEPVRSIFFRWLFDSRKKFIGRDFGDYDDRKQVFGSDLNELITDCLQYAASVPDPLCEIREWSQKREIETRGRTPLAVAMSHYDGMTADDFQSLRPLCA